MRENRKVKLETNREFMAKNTMFANACEVFNVPKTKRQASKFRMGKGNAYNKLQASK